MLGEHLIVHTQSAMGATGTNGSTLTVRDALDFWELNSIIMVGIAFGINPDNQKVGDVFISRSIIPYDSKKIVAGQHTPRGTPLTPNNILLDRFLKKKPPIELDISYRWKIKFHFTRGRSTFRRNINK